MAHGGPRDHRRSVAPSYSRTCRHGLTQRGEALGRRLDRMGVSQDATWPNGSSVALVIVGLALFWQFLRHTNLMALFMPVTVGSAIVMPDDWASLFYAIALVLALVGAEFLSHVARKPLAVLALGATASCCAVGLQITCRVFSETIAPEAITACQLIESSLYAMVLCVLAIVWSLYCGHANMHPRWMLLSLLGSSFTGIVLAAIIFKPLPDKGLLSSFLPLLACLLGARASRSIMRTEGLQSQQVMRDMPTRARARHAMTARLTVPGGDIPATHVTRQARISMIVFITVLVISTCAKAVFDTLLADASLGELLQVKDAVTVAVIAPHHGDRNAHGRIGTLSSHRMGRAVISTRTVTAHHSTRRREHTLADRRCPFVSDTRELRGVHPGRCHATRA